MLEIVADGLQELLSDVVFVGGATTALYIPSAAENGDSGIRATDDVDCVIEVTSRIAYARIEERLRVLGFRNAGDGPICRWKYSGITVDVMPTDEAILGFSNRWYQPAISTSEKITLPNKIEIRIFTVPYFLATKTEAFNARGGGDFQASRDFEDLITVLDGRPTIRTEIAVAPEDVRRFLKETVAKWEKSPTFTESLMGQLPASRRTLEGARRVLDVLRNIP